MIDWMKDLLQRIKEDTAKAYKSWTVWFNGVLAALNGAWLYLLANPDLLQQAHDALPQLDGMLSPKVLTALTVCINLVNVALRYKTSARLADK